MKVLMKNEEEKEMKRECKRNLHYWIKHLGRTEEEKEHQKHWEENSRVKWLG